MIEEILMSVLVVLGLILGILGGVYLISMFSSKEIIAVYPLPEGFRIVRVYDDKVAIVESTPQNVKIFQQSLK